MTVFLEEKESFAVSSAGTLTGMAKNIGEGDNAYGKRKTCGRIFFKGKMSNTMIEEELKVNGTCGSKGYGGRYSGILCS